MRTGTTSTMAIKEMRIRLAFSPGLLWSAPTPAWLAGGRLAGDSSAVKKEEEEKKKHPSCGDRVCLNDYFLFRFSPLLVFFLLRQTERWGWDHAAGAVLPASQRPVDSLPPTE